MSCLKSKVTHVLLAVRPFLLLPWIEQVRHTTRLKFESAPGVTYAYGSLEARSALPVPHHGNDRPDLQTS
ncbi:hypothetical protein VTN77DRAFT_2520 [Rasamsonia byssochlamydoides]|uniref:uncharacterized protein n=1 Tax=Rasamsonia byssochlamydoides TaxID=89139 RepID=UPI003743DFDF